MENYLPIFSENDKQWIYVDQFVKFLRDHVHVNDRRKEIKNSDVLRVFASYKAGVELYNGRKCVGVASALRYIFHHMDTSHICDQICQTVVAQFTGNKTTMETITLLDLYKELSKSDAIQILHGETIKLENESLPVSLMEDYQKFFDVTEWNKIILFEYHFSKYYDISLSYEESLRSKWIFLGQVKEASRMGKQIVCESRKELNHRMNRFRSASCQSGIELTASTKIHLHSMLEKSLEIHLEKIFSGLINSIVCAETEETLQNDSIHVYVEVTDRNTTLSSSLASEVQHTLCSNHNLKAKLVCVLDEGTFKDYTDEAGAVTRYKLRDDIIMRKLLPQTIDCVKISTDCGPLNSDSELKQCSSCFQDHQPQPLHFTSFDLYQEWSKSVPLTVQAVIQQFINSASLERADNKSNYLQGKLQRLYNLYDSLLNVTNKKYCGIFQQANTEELILGHRCVGTVFKITSQSGASSSLKSAERQLTQKCLPDDRYYETFLKGYRMEYATKEGTSSALVRLRDCYNILLIDNLVRLKFNEDPNPGESRSKQMCTLPITIQGLPQNAAVVNTWHVMDICDGSPECLCKKNAELKPSDFDRLVIGVSDIEKKCLDQFQNLSTWGCSIIWKCMDKHIDLLKHLYKEIDQEGFVWQNTEDKSGSPEDNYDTEDMNGVESSLHMDRAVNEAGSSLVTENDIFDDEFEDENLEEILKTACTNVSNNIDELSFSNSFQCLDLDESNEDQVSMPIEDVSDIVTNINDKDEDIQSISQSMEGVASFSELTVPMPIKFGFEKNVCPPLLTRHPPPYSGRDDDLFRLKDIIDDLLVKLGNYDGIGNKILCGPDNKIGSNLIKLIKMDQKYDSILPEFPCLHLRKSLINSIFSAYKNAGLVQLLQYMKDDDQKEWTKLITAEHIDVATKNVKRLSHAFHTAFMVKFLGYLPQPEAQMLLYDLQNDEPQALACKWQQKYVEFVERGCQRSGTFVLHQDMMKHLDHVLAISLAERLGGADGYNLLLATIKEYLPFAFVNGATSYAPFCLELLHQHHRNGPFYQNMKAHLFSTPLKESNVNFATDTKRELEHIDCMKGFRSGSTLNSVLKKMSLVDSLNEVHGIRNPHPQKEDKVDTLGWTITTKDMDFVLPTTSLILRQHGITFEECNQPHNVYSKEKLVLSSAYLDKNCLDVGKYMMQKYAVKEDLYKLSTADLKDPKDLQGPKDIVTKAKNSKGTTLKRSSLKSSFIKKSERQVKEEKRKAVLARQMKKIDSFSSEMNTCQALVKPDCTKPKVVKSAGMSAAVCNALLQWPEKITSEEIAQEVQKINCAFFNKAAIPDHISSKVTFATVEFAGVKFKSNVVNGLAYIKQVQNGILKPMLHQMKKLSRIVVCEEKYKFTPDPFKAATHQQRKGKKAESISHLRTESEMLSHQTFKKDALLTTAEGKALISTYLGQNVSKLELKNDIVLDIDSELYTEGCVCKTTVQSCQCPTYSVPIRAVFSKELGFKEEHKLKDICQRKGEAEMSQVDWLLTNSANMKDGDVAASIVTSGDIDALVLHMFALSMHWPKDQFGKYKFPVYVILQKPGKRNDIFNVTNILEVFEERYDDTNIGAKVAIALCIGGNDFIPKMFGINHSTVLKQYLSHTLLQSNLVSFVPEIKLSLNNYILLIKLLYCPKNLNVTTNSFEEIRSATMYKKSKTKKIVYKPAQRWMPPESALEHLAELVQLQIEYLKSLGNPKAFLPNFLAKSCLKKTSTGQVEYYFGPDSHMSLPMDIEHTPKTPMKMKKRMSVTTPQKGDRRKRKPKATSTPVKDD